MLAPDNDQWCRFIPHTFRALADPGTRSALPRIGDERDIYDACAAWEPVHYLLTVLLGWESPGEGLAWWYAAGKPHEDSPVLALIRHHWDANRRLDYYAAHLWAQGCSVGTPETLSPTELAKSSMFPDEDWWRMLKRRGRELRDDPLYGGGNPLHLGHSDALGCDQIQPDRATFHVDPKKLHAVLVVNDIASWRHDLRRATEGLTAPADRSWHVEVFDRKTGFLGLFRRSRVTGKWFVGQHDVHMRGN